jgi:chlorophyllide a reductase subunit Z
VALFLPWEADAREALEAALEKQPLLVRISAAKRMREAAERAARAAGDDKVSVAAVRRAVADTERAA